MLQYYEIEQLAFEQHAAFLDEAAHQRLLRSALDAADNQGWWVALRRRVGGRLVQWGLRLQGEDALVLPDPAIGQPCASLQ
jgi:hypothetical protein